MTPIEKRARKGRKTERKGRQKIYVVFFASFALLLASFARNSFSSPPDKPFRPPAVPLVACDPYFSIWSNADRLTDDATRHWTKAPHRLGSQIQIDGQLLRVMGDQPEGVPALGQVSLKVLPTRTIYDFEGKGVHLTLTFLTAALPEDLMLVSRPLTYLTWDVRSVDGALHTVSIGYENSSEPVINIASQAVEWSEPQIPGLSVARVGTKDQPVLAKSGDNLRIDWGYLYTAVPKGAGTEMNRKPRFTVRFDLGQVAAKSVSRWLMLAYDDEYSIQFFGKNLRPYWRRDGADAGSLLRLAAQDYPTLQKRCQAFDAELMADLTRAGGEKYARMCALAYRQCFAANKIAADPNRQPLLFPKENTSNGCIATVDVIYPMAPQFLLFSPSLTKAMLVHVLNYAASPRWPFPYAPHDLGKYPLANGQVYGGGEKTEKNQMPVEETGNMLILVDALAQIEGNASFAARHWPVLEKWAEYLKAKGFDPENQLCTDDFAGHLAHNVNLSAKAIVALGAYGDLLKMRGDRAAAESYGKLARQFAARWLKAADDGDHFRLAFDAPGSWSQKYNLVWDRILGLNLFPPEALRKEMAFYRHHLNRYGLPLDNRKTWAKLDWSMWTATLTGSRPDFEAISSPVYDFLNDTPQRVPMNDLYWTENATEKGMHARPVVGGVFLKMLYDRAVWKKWAGRDKNHPDNWAPLPPRP